MRPPGQIKKWLSIEQMFKWLKDAPDEQSYKRRLSVWLTHTGRLHAHKIAEILGVSTQAVWLWIRQYNTDGPAGLDRKGRGGRRWGMMTVAQEAKMLKPFIQRANSGRPPKPAQIKQIIEQNLNKKVSMPYIYRLLSRHNWSKVIAQSHKKRKSKPLPDSFEKFSRPWLRSV